MIETWIQCDACSKWRRVTTQYAEEVGDNPWKCGSFPGGLLSCETPEEQYQDVEDLEPGMLKPEPSSGYDEEEEEEEGGAEGQQEEHHEVYGADADAAEHAEEHAEGEAAFVKPEPPLDHEEEEEEDVPVHAQKRPRIGPASGELSHEEEEEEGVHGEQQLEGQEEEEEAAAALDGLTQMAAAAAEEELEQGQQEPNGDAPLPESREGEQPPPAQDA